MIAISLENKEFETKFWKIWTVENKIFNLYYLNVMLNIWQVRKEEVETSSLCKYCSCSSADPGSGSTSPANPSPAACNTFHGFLTKMFYHFVFKGTVRLIFSNPSNCYLSNLFKKMRKISLIFCLNR